jgi:flavodoxin I
MANVRIFYGSTTGNTGEVAATIADLLGKNVEYVRDISSAAADDLAKADALILGVSTWDDGQLQQDWENFFPKLDKIDLKGKPVALFGLGDSYGFGEQFCNGLGILYRKVVERAGNVVGFWPNAGYSFKASEALVDGHFCGLVLDQDNEQTKTPERVQKWVEQIRGELCA